MYILALWRLVEAVEDALEAAFAINVYEELFGLARLGLELSILDINIFSGKIWKGFVNCLVFMRKVFG